MKPYNCPLCQDGPGFLIKHDKLVSEKDSIIAQQTLLENEEKKIILDQRNLKSQQEAHSSENCYQQLQKSLENIKIQKNNIVIMLKNVSAIQVKAIANKNRYQNHLKQLETCRLKVIQAAEELTVGECLVYRDFVNQHNEHGKKINNFVLVVLYREVENGDLLVLNLSNIIEYAKDGSCDAYFVADVFTFHMKQGGSGLFDRFHTIIISGDHGPHFSSAETIYHESTFYAKYKKKIRVLSLCSYHAYNRCDAAGAAVKQLARGRAKENLALISSSDYVFAVRENGQSNAWSYEFSTINRSKYVFDGNGCTDSFPVVQGQKLKLSEMCQLEYCFQDEFGNDSYQEGIVLARPIIGEPISSKQAFYVLDVSKGSKARGFCHKCSNRFQRPVYHETAKCLDMDHIHVSDNGGLFVTMNLNAVPDGSRLIGTQLNKAQQKASQSTKMGKFPCRFEECSYKSYNSAYNANKHMAGKHHEHESEATRKIKSYSKVEENDIKSKFEKKKPRKRTIGEFEEDKVSIVYKSKIIMILSLIHI